MPLVRGGLKQQQAESVSPGAPLPSNIFSLLLGILRRPPESHEIYNLSSVFRVYPRGLLPVEHAQKNLQKEAS